MKCPICGKDTDIEEKETKEGRAMKCPLFSIALASLAGYQSPAGGDCLKEKCAWWSSLSEKCRIDLIECQLDGIRTALFDIAEKKGG